MKTGNILVIDDDAEIREIVQVHGRNRGRRNAGIDNADRKDIFTGCDHSGYHDARYGRIQCLQTDP